MLWGITLVISWLYIFILLAGDIESNPGPEDSDPLSSFSSAESTKDMSVFEDNFSFVHCNIQSLYTKIDQLQIELFHFDIIALSETWLTPNIKDTDIMFLNYQSPFRKDRLNNNYGGVIVYV